MGFRVVISRVISRVPFLMTHIRGLITPLITTPEPPSRVSRRHLDDLSLQSSLHVMT